MRIWTMALAIGCAGASGESEEETAHEEMLIGSWRAVPPDVEIRRLKVIDAAMAGQPSKKRALGDLTNAEKALFDDWSAKRGVEAQNMKAELRFLDGARIEFTDTQATVRFGPNAYGPADYEVLGATEKGIQVQFDPGLGNGMETHDIRWDGADRGTDVITSTRRGAFSPLALQRQ